MLCYFSTLLFQHALLNHTRNVATQQQIQLSKFLQGVNNYLTMNTVQAMLLAVSNILTFEQCLCF